MRLSKTSSKTGKKCIFGVFWQFQRLCQMPFASINSTNPRTNPLNVHKRILRVGGAGKSSSQAAARLYELSFISALWMVSSESWKRLHPSNWYMRRLSLLREADCSGIFSSSTYRNSHLCLHLHYSINPIIRNTVIRKNDCI